MSDKTLISEMSDLLDATCDGRLDAVGQARLDYLVCTDLRAAEFYVHYMHLHDHLRHQAFADDLSADVSVPDLAHAKPLSFFSLHRRPMRYALAASLILMVGALGSVMMSLSVKQTDEYNGIVRQGFASLTGSTDAVFGESDVPTAVGSQLPAGFLRLRSGTVQVEFYSGAQVTLEGPCEFGINSASRGFLKVGRIAAYVPDKAHGFTVGAPKYAVVDLGTRFIMTVREGGDSSVRVTEGKVELQSGTKVQPLTVWQTAQVDASGTIHDVVAETDPALVPVTDSLRSGKLPAGLDVVGDFAELTPRGMAVTGKGPAGGGEKRTYIRTVRTDWYQTNFIAEVTVDVPDTTETNAITFFGMGGAEMTKVTPFQEPIFGPHVLAVMWPGGNIDSRIDSIHAEGKTVAKNLHIRGGTHKLRMVWDADTEKARFELEEGNKGVVTAKFEIDASKSIFNALSSRILFGGGGGLVFRDFSVTPAEVIP